MHGFDFKDWYNPLKSYPMGETPKINTFGETRETAEINYLIARETYNVFARYLRAYETKDPSIFVKQNWDGLGESMVLGDGDYVPITTLRKIVDDTLENVFETGGRLAQFQCYANTRFTREHAATMDPHDLLDYFITTSFYIEPSLKMIDDYINFIKPRDEKYYSDDYVNRYVRLFDNCLKYMQNKNTPIPNEFVNEVLNCLNEGCRIPKYKPEDYQNCSSSSESFCRLTIALENKIKNAIYMKFSDIEYKKDLYKEYYGKTDGFIYDDNYLEEIGFNAWTKSKSRKSRNFDNALNYHRALIHEEETRVD